MTAERWGLIQEVFLAALERHGEEREAFVRSACLDDADLNQQVTSLLSSLEQAGSFIADAVAQESLEIETEHSPQPGERVGAYRLVRAIGRGGMGIVYLAERAEGDFHQQAAIKVMRDGFASPASLARFRAERQILAELDHPHIARLLDGGSTPAGTPYIVMEFVDGIPITEYCRRSAHSLRERVKLFRDVCSAVHYAHQHLVVHRDIKPNNTLVDGHGTVKLLDFGIAKLLDPGMAPFALAETRPLERLLTPEYASPEQIRGEPITTVSDVYSLGCLLYELAAGNQPLATAGKPPTEIERIVCEVEPPLLEGDLGRIVRKAMHKDQARRYSSADALSEDLRRWLEGRAVMARPDDLWYRTWRFAGRNKAPIGAVLAIVASLSAGLIVARREQAKAERRFAQVREISSSFLFEFHDAIRDLPGSTPARKLVVQRALQYLDGLAAEAGGDTKLRMELATAYSRISAIQYSPGNPHLGDIDGAVRSFARSADLYQSAIAEDGANTAAAIKLAEVRAQQAVIEMNTKGDASKVRKLEEAAMQAALGIARKPGLTNADKAGIAGVLRNSGNVLANAGRPADALPALREASRLNRELITADPGNRDHAWLYAWTLVDIGDALGGGGREIQLGDRNGALAQFKLAEPLFRKGVEDPDDARAQRSLGVLFARFAALYGVMNDPAGALRYDRLALESAQKLAAADPASAEDQRNLAVAWNNLGRGLATTGDLAESRRALLQASELRERFYRQRPGDARALADVCSTWHNLGETYLKARRFDEAETYVKKALALREKAVKNNFALMWRQAKSWELLGQVHEAERRRRDAAQDDSHAAELFDQLTAAGKLAPADRGEAARLRGQALTLNTASR